MATPAKKQSFLGGAAILAAAVVVVKIIGAVYKLPLNNILGGAGKTYFDTAYRIYNFLLTFSTAGLPLAISRMTSQAHAQGLENEKRKIFRTAIWLFFGLGLVCSVLMFTQADGLARFLNNSLAAPAVRALAPAVFCVCLLACMRGYTQGQGNMAPTAVSQVLEALLKLGIGLPLAWYALHIGLSDELGAAGAIVGVTAGTVVSMLFLCIYLATHRNRQEALDTPSSSGAIIKSILLIGVPITLSNSAMSIINIIDTKIVMGRLQSALGLSETAAAVLNGQYSMAMDMPNMVASFVYPVTMSLIPFAAAALARQDHGEADRIISSAFRLIAILALPAGVGLSVLSTPIELLVLPMQREDALAAGPHLHLSHDSHQRHFADLRQGAASHFHRHRRRRGESGHELHFGGQSEHQHSRRAHFYAVLLSDHLRLEFVLRVEVFPGEAPVHPTIRKAGAGLCPDGRRRVGSVRSGVSPSQRPLRLRRQRAGNAGRHSGRCGGVRRIGGGAANPAGRGYKSSAEGRQNHQTFAPEVNNS